MTPPDPETIHRAIVHFGGLRATARALGVKPVVVGRWRNGRRVPGRRFWEALEEAAAEAGEGAASQTLAEQHARALAALSVPGTASAWARRLGVCPTATSHWVRARKIPPDRVPEILRIAEAERIEPIPGGAPKQERHPRTAEALALLGSGRSEWAKRLGVPVKTVHTWIAGRRPMPVKWVEATFRIAEPAQPAPSSEGPAELLEAAIRAAGSQAALARRLGVNGSTITHWWKRGVPGARLLELAAAAEARPRDASPASAPRQRRERSARKAPPRQRRERSARTAPHNPLLWRAAAAAGGFAALARRLGVEKSRAVDWWRNGLPENRMPLIAEIAAPMPEQFPPDLLQQAIDKAGSRGALCGAMGIARSTLTQWEGKGSIPLSQIGRVWAYVADNPVRDRYSFKYVTDRGVVPVPEGAIARAVAVVGSHAALAKALATVPSKISEWKATGLMQRRLVARLLELAGGHGE